MRCSEQPWSQVLASVSAARRSPSTGVSQQDCEEATGEKVCIQKRRRQEIPRFSTPPLLLARCLVDLLSRFAIIRRRNASWLAANPDGGFMKRTAIALKIPQYQRDHGLFSLDICLSRCTMASAKSMHDSVQKSLNSFDYCSSFANHWMSLFPRRWCELRDARKQFGCL
jgi:hypothetical protein